MFDRVKYASVGDSSTVASSKLSNVALNYELEFVCILTLRFEAKN